MDYLMTHEFLGIKVLQHISSCISPTEFYIQAFLEHGITSTWQDFQCQAGDFHHPLYQND